MTIVTENSDLDYVTKNRKMTLPVPLSDLEIAELAREAAKQDIKLRELEQQAADAKSEWKEKLAMKSREIETLRADIEREKQDRVILVDEIFDNGLIKTIRRDSGVVVASRPASPQEAQRHLPAMEGTGVGLLADAARAQKAAGVEEDEDGDVVAPEGDGGPKRRKRKA